MPGSLFRLPSGSCWAFATVDAIATAFAILLNNSSPSSLPPFLPASQLLNTPAATVPPCGGGDPVSALKYILDVSTKGGGLKPSADGGTSNLQVSSLAGRMSARAWVPASAGNLNASNVVCP